MAKNLYSYQKLNIPLRLALSLETFDRDLGKLHRGLGVFKRLRYTLWSIGVNEWMLEVKQFSFLSAECDKVEPESSSQLGLRKHLNLCFCLWESVFIDVAVCYLGRAGQSHPEERRLAVFYCSSSSVVWTHLFRKGFTSIYHRFNHKRLSHILKNEFPPCSSALIPLPCTSLSDRKDHRAGRALLSGC